MQVSYNNKNIKLNYLNSYVKYIFFDNGVSFYNTIYNTKVELLGKEDALKELIFKLINGVSNKELLELLKKFNNKDEALYKYLLQNFIIE